MAAKCQFLSGNWRKCLATSRKLLRLQSILHLFWAVNQIILCQCSVCVWEAAAITIDLHCYVGGGAVILMHFCVFQAKRKRLRFFLGGRSVREATALLGLLLSSSEWFLFVCLLLHYNNCLATYCFCYILISLSLQNSVKLLSLLPTRLCY